MVSKGKFFSRCMSGGGASYCIVYISIDTVGLMMFIVSKELVLIEGICASVQSLHQVVWMCVFAPQFKSCRSEGYGLGHLHPSLQRLGCCPTHDVLRMCACITMCMAFWLQVGRWSYGKGMCGQHALLLMFWHSGINRCPWLW